MRASNDPNFQRIQELVRFPQKRLQENPELIDDFITLCSDHLTFVEDWNDHQITPSTMRLYSKKIPAKEAARDFAARVRSHIPAADLRERVSDDVEKSRYSHQEWYRASDRNSTLLSQKLKEPQSLLFFCGAIYVRKFQPTPRAFTQSQQ